MDAPETHRPVLLAEAVAALAIQPDGLYVDATFGRGGHSRAILEKLSPAGRLIALDRDPQAIAAGREITDPRFTLVHAAFSRLDEVLTAQGIGQVDGILLDVGVSSPQLDDPSRGMSFRFDAPLDMRMDTTQGETAADFLANADQRQIEEVIREYGEERFAHALAKALVAARSGHSPIDELANAHFARNWECLPDAIKSFQEWISAHEKPRLIVIDTFQKIRSRAANRSEDNAYARDYVEVGLLHQLAARNNISILLVHHKRKAASDDPFNGVSGSSGITGAADAIWLFEKPDRERMVAKLFISGRDIPDRKYALAWNDRTGFGGWKYVIESDDGDSKDSEQNVKLAMAQIGRPASVSEICLGSGVQQRQVYRILEKLKLSGHVARATGLAGKYILTPEAATQMGQNPSGESDYPEDWDEM